MRYLITALTTLYAPDETTQRSTWIQRTIKLARDLTDEEVVERFLYKHPFIKSSHDGCVYNMRACVKFEIERLDE